MAIEIRNLSKTYIGRGESAVHALHDISMTVADGEFVTLVGPSGCGKSTLLDIINGLIPRTSGSAIVNGRDAGAQPEGMGVVFQKPILLDWKTVTENVYLPATVGRPPAERSDSGLLRRRTTELLEMVGLTQFADRYPWELSGGMQARVAIARALLLETKVLSMDEPFAALDEFTREQMHMELLRLWEQQQFTTVFVTHNIYEAVFLSDRVLVMTPRPGRIVEDVRTTLGRPRRREMIGSSEFSEDLRRVRSAMATYWNDATAERLRGGDG